MLSHQSGCGPVDPLAWIPDSAVEQTVRLKNGRVGLLIQQELIEEGEESRVEVCREEAVAVVSDLDKAVVVCDPHRLPNSMSSSHAAEPAQGTQPLEVGVLVRDHRPRCDHSSERVVVVGEKADVEDIIVEVRREPDVLLDDLRRLLHDITTILLKLRQPPACISTRAGFLRDGKGDALLECSCHQSTFAVAGASRNGNLVRINMSIGSVLEGVDNAAEAPHPSSHRARGSVLAVDVVEETNAPTGLVILLRHLAIGISQDCDLEWGSLVRQRVCTNIEGGSPRLEQEC